MSRKVMSKVELEERREELIAAHKAETRRNRKHRSSAKGTQISGYWR